MSILIKKISDDGIKGLFFAIIHHMCRMINYCMFILFKLFPIKDNYIVLESEGDCCDNAYALFEYMKSNGYVGKYKITWLVDNPDRFNENKDIKYVYKSNVKLGLIRNYRLAVSKFYIYDHCNVYLAMKCKWRNQQKIINLSHGCGFKVQKGKSGEINIFDECYVTGKFYYENAATFHKCGYEKIIDIGFPRLDYLFKELNQNQLNFIDKYNFEQYALIALWMPTFRKSISEHLSEEYFNSLTGLPILENDVQLKKFDEFLASKNILCVFKIHHLQATQSIFKEKYSNILILNDEMISEENLQLYQFVKLTDLLITDYSSIANDYLLMDKPILYTLDDYNEYKKSRGFLMEDPIKYFIGYHVYNEEDLMNALEDVIENGDVYKDARREIITQMHTYCDGNASKRILEHLGIT